MNHEILLESHILLKRNFQGLPLIAHDNDPALSMAALWIQQLLPRLPVSLQRLNLSTLSKAQRISLVEQGFLPNDVENVDLPLFLNMDAGFAILIGHQNHITLIQVEGSQNGNLLSEIDEVIRKEHPYATHPDFGYLTKKPWESGCAMLCEAIVHLPLIDFQQDELELQNAALQKDGFTLEQDPPRSGHGIMCLSNHLTYGVTEEELRQRFEDCVRRLALREEALRQNLSEESKFILRDRAFRGYGTLQYALEMDGPEFYQLYSGFRLGVQMGWLPLPLSLCREIWEKSRKGSVLNNVRDPDDPSAEGRVRCEILHRLLG